MVLALYWFYRPRLEHGSLRGRHPAAVEVAATQATGDGNLTVVASLITNSMTGVGSAAGTTVNVTNNTLINNTKAFAVAGTFNSANDNKIAGATDTPNGAMTIK